ncbi:MAG TPA: zf-HC2 domain-containing protein [Pararobbsia sp.]|nr:zf-HC2 domain-containing protein [Pararobbsia sp.]
MSFDDTFLMAYVDGELPPSRRAEIDEAIASSPELAHRVTVLRASVLPYQAAFARRAVPAVPASLEAFVAELARTGVAPETPSGVAPETPAVTPETAPASAPAGTASLDAAREARQARQARPARRSGLWLAAAFIAGAFVCGAALKAGRMIDPVTPWLDAAAGYQELYTRETIANVQDNPAADAKLLDDVRVNDHLPIAIPDLREAGLTFKRIQRLRFHGRPLIQIVYLPERGDPVALCVIDAKADQPMKSQHVYGMDVVSWSQDKLAFALIGHKDVVDLAALHRQLTDNPSQIRVD